MSKIKLESQLQDLNNQLEKFAKRKAELQSKQDQLTAGIKTPQSDNQRGDVGWKRL